MKFLKSKKIELLKKFFEKEPSVILAFLFGSYAKGLEMKESDFDVAVYLKDYYPSPGPLSELNKPEEIREIERKIWIGITRLVGKEIDLVCLNQAPASLISDIFETGIPLKIGDEKLYWELYLRKSSEAEDFSEFVDDFFRISKKAKSLSPVAKVKLEKRLHFLDKELREIEEFKKLTFEEYCDDRTKKRNIEKWAENIINALIDIAKITLASEKKEMPKSYGDALFYFGFMAGLNEKESEKLSEFASLRNILAHEYLEVLYSRIQYFIKEFPSLYQKIDNFLEKYLK